MPGGAPHTYKTVGPTPGRALLVLAPGSAMERFFAEAGTPVNGRANLEAPAGPPSADQIARLFAVAGRHGIAFSVPHAATAAPAAAGQG